MATTKPLVALMKSPARLTGLFLIALFFSGCQTGKSPEDVTSQFWQALAQGQIDKAKNHATENSQQLVNSQDIEKNSVIEIGEAMIENSDASVQTTIMRHKKRITFNTVLLLEKDQWKVDYLQTQMNISMIPLGDVLKSLQHLGGAFTKQLEQQLPLIQKEMESLGDELKKQIDEFGRSLEKPQDPNAKKPYPGSI